MSPARVDPSALSPLQTTSQRTLPADNCAATPQYGLAVDSSVPALPKVASNSKAAIRGRAPAQSCIMINTRCLLHTTPVKPSSHHPSVGDAL